MYDKNVVPTNTWNNIDALNNFLCLKCNDGEFSEEGSINCQKCIPGKAGKNGFCAKCPINTLDSFGGTVCENCEEGQCSTAVSNYRNRLQNLAHPNT